MCVCRLMQLKGRILAARMVTPLFDTEKYTHDLEDLYTAMWDRHEKGLPPDHITQCPPPLSYSVLEVN